MVWHCQLLIGKEISDTLHHYVAGSSREFNIVLDRRTCTVLPLHTSQLNKDTSLNCLYHRVVY
jgi:hypothetical protein